MKMFIACFLASFGFGLIFNIPKNKAFYAGLTGGIGGLVYFISLNFNISETVALLLSSIVFSLFSEILARILKCPSTMFSICALIPFVPGGKIFLAMVEVIDGNLSLALNYGLTTVFQASALVIGMVVVSGLFMAFKTKRIYRS